MNKTWAELMFPKPPRRGAEVGVEVRIEVEFVSVGSTSSGVPVIALRVQGEGDDLPEHERVVALKEGDALQLWVRSR